ncbi:TPA: hypothetical protein ACIIUZ_004552 [Klebsiella pneumoniae]
MPRRSILSAAERESLLALPDTKGVSLDIENYCTLGSFFDHQ